MSSVAYADAETRSLLDVTSVGAYKYANHESTDALVWCWAIDGGPPQVWSPDWAWPGRSDPIQGLYKHIADGGYFVAWNAFFDRWIWNAVMVRRYGAPRLPLEQVLCAQAQAEANNLPGRLEKAAECLGTPHKKDPQGKRLIGLLSDGNKPWTERNMHKDRMGRFRAYCVHDVVAMRDIWECTRPLTMVEWDEYHASERVNDRGVAVDVEFAAAARDYAEDELEDINGHLARITGDRAMTITNHLKKAAWLHDALEGNQELQEVMTKPPKRKDGAPRKSCDRATREALLELLAQPGYSDVFPVEHRERIIEFLETIEAGNSAAVRKFTAIVNQAVSGRVRGQYSFNGAGQTGRFSSRGIQIHNLIRDPVDKENPDRALDAIEAILAGAKPNDLVSEFGFPISRLLARLVRPTFVASGGRTLVWADYDQIEGRTLPWLADTPQASAKLDLYRNGIDTYKVAAVPIFQLDGPDAASDKQRQVGKVAELALGFGGAVGAFAAMGRGYGITLPESDVQAIVNAWRAQNGWVLSFWDKLWSAMMRAFKQPMVWFPAGKVQYLFHPGLMRGTMICKLPSGRWLVYPQFQHDWVEYTGKSGRPERKLRTSFVRGFGSGHARLDLWYGSLAENVTQATAADMLRLAIRRLDDILVLHTHDEVVAEVPEKRVDEFRERVHDEMTRLPDWAEGLPLSVTVEHGPYYTK